jgi:hypothetical protein
MRQFTRLCNVYSMGMDLAGECVQGPGQELGGKEASKRVLQQVETVVL